MTENGYLSLMVKSIRQNAGLVAFSDYQGSSYTYQEVGIQILKLHQQFEKLGIRKGEHIAIVGRNMSGWAIAYLSVVSYGAVVVPILPDFSTSDIHHIVNHSGSVLLFATDLQFDKIDQAEMPHLKAILSLPDFGVFHDPHRKLAKGKSSPLPDLNSWEPPFRGADEPMVLSYTSGTSGFSKGVLLPHRSIWSNVAFALRRFDMRAGERIVSFLPLAHAYGCLFEFLWPFTIGCHITFLTKTPSPRVITEAFQNVKPHLILSVPLILEKIFKKNILPQLQDNKVKTLLRIPVLNKLVYSKVNKKLYEVFGGEFREMVIGGAALNHDVEDFLRKIGFPLTVGYGMTECGPLISYTPAKETKLRSAGQVVDRLEVKIDSSDPVNEVGEIMVRGDNCLLGYYKNPEATAEILDADGWMHTGDLGVMDKDNFIYIRGRSKAMILGASGQNVYPEEVEAVLNSMDFVQESVVRDMGGGKLEALIYPDYERADALRMDHKELDKTLQALRSDWNKVLPAYMNISKITLFPEEFEKTPKRSIKRYIYNTH